MIVIQTVCPNRFPWQRNIINLPLLLGFGCTSITVKHGNKRHLKSLRGPSFLPCALEASCHFSEELVGSCSVRFPGRRRYLAELIPPDVHRNLIYLSIGLYGHILTGRPGLMKTANLVHFTLNLSYLRAGLRLPSRSRTTHYRFSGIRGILLKHLATAATKNFKTKSVEDVNGSVADSQHVNRCPIPCLCL